MNLLREGIKDLVEYLFKILALVRFLSIRGRGRFVFAGCFLALSRGMQMIAFFMPIKVLIVMASTTNPAYFEFFLEYVSLDAIVVILLAAVPVSYAAYIIMGMCHRRILDADMKVQSSKKLSTSTYSFNAKQLATLHRRLDKAFSDLLLMVLAIVAMLLIEPMIALVSLLLVIINLLIFNFYVYDAKEETRLTFFKLHRRQFVEYVTSSNFLFVFFVLAVSVKVFDLDVYSAVLVLLLSRMLFQAVQRFSIESLLGLKHLSRLN